ncbi:hypothetical protein RZS08_26815, partial [Arthrospira platensis SPKY1]|nr:hypothetical protein [Arthrospira platensis SPKY1]
RARSDWGRAWAAGRAGKNPRTIVPDRRGGFDECQTPVVLLRAVRKKTLMIRANEIWPCDGACMEGWRRVSVLDARERAWISQH